MTKPPPEAKQPGVLNIGWPQIGKVQAQAAKAKPLGEGQRTWRGFTGSCPKPKPTKHDFLKWQQTRSRECHQSKGKGKPHLLKLPLKTRQTIIHYTMDRTVFIKVPAYFPTPESHPVILQICRQLRREALPTFYDTNTFVFVIGGDDSSLIFKRWLERASVHYMVIKKLIWLRKDTAYKHELTLLPSSVIMSFSAMVSLDLQWEANLNANLEVMLGRGGRPTQPTLLKAFNFLNYNGHPKPAKTVKQGQQVADEEGAEEVEEE